jgi:hypothetical protein
MHDRAIAALAVRGFEHQHQIGGADDAGFVAFLGSEIAECESPELINVCADLFQKCEG